MQKSRFTVFFEPPFWVCMCERVENGYLTVCKITFGAEPKDGEIYAFLQNSFYHLVFGPAIETKEKIAAKTSPKRMQRAVARQMRRSGVAPKAQQALALARQQNKAAKKEKIRAKKLEEQQRQFSLRTQKRKEKHKGH